MTDYNNKNLNFRSLKVLLTAGGTGGHLFPAIALAEELDQLDNVKPLLITDLRCAKYLPNDFKIKKYIVDIHLQFSGLWNKIKSFKQIFTATFKAYLILYKEKPDVIIGFGGYPSFPAMMAAQLLKIPMIIHEQNCFMGRVNLFFAKDAKIIATSYENTKNIAPEYSSKIVMTGNLVRKSLINNVKYNPSGKVFNLFIMGGSQGASFFSKIVPKSIKLLLDENPDIKIHITQQVSENDKEEVAKQYQAIGVECELSSFFKDVAKIYAKTHLMISRSGASTIAEVIQTKIPTIYIPYPHAADDHQFFNAIAMVDNQAGWCYRQEDINATILAKHLAELISDRKKLELVSQNIAKLDNKNAVKNLTDTVLKIIS